jgi:2,4-diketo-3-deoxy-L-fuconate hydrolase
MRLCRFDDDRLGVVVGNEIADITAITERLTAHRYPLPRFDPLIAAFDTLRPAIESLATKADRRPLLEVHLLSPVANPGKVVAAPVNYKKHLDEARADAEIHNDRQIAEIQKAGLFLKATSSIVGPHEGVTISHPDRRNDHEVELVAVIGKVARDVMEKDALGYIAGYCIGLDMSVRGSEDRSFRKSVDSFTVLGPWLSTPEECPDVTNMNLSLEVNGEKRQSANTSDLVLSVAQLIAYASTIYTLYPGDVIMTGTPEGVGPVKDGDLMTASVENIGSMQVGVRLRRRS